MSLYERQLEKTGKFVEALSAATQDFRRPVHEVLVDWEGGEIHLYNEWLNKWDKVSLPAWEEPQGLKGFRKGILLTLEECLRNAQIVIA